MSCSGTPSNICVISTTTSDSVGGLASYMRFLMRHLCRDCPVSAAGRFQVKGPPRVEYEAAEPPRIIDNGLFQTRIIAPKGSFRPALRRLRHFVSRSRLQPIAISVFIKAYQSSLRDAIPSGVNVVHYVGNGWELLGFAALAEARKRGTAFTVLPAVHPGTWGDSALDIRLYNQADAVLTLSEFEKQHLVGLGADPRRLHVIGLGPATQGTGDGQRFRAQHRLGKRPLVLFVGRKDRSKGYHPLCEAMTQVLDALPEACLVAIGPDIEPPYPSLPAGALLDLGRADEQTKEDALAACDVFCIPSAHESFGIVNVEAWAYGKPVIGGPSPAVRELVTDDVNGFCVSQNKDEIAAVLIRLLSDPALCQRLGAAGRQLQQERFTWEAVTDAHKKIFQEALSTAKSERQT